jgi:hypothetical protein
MRRINGDYEPEIQNAIRLPKKFISDLQRLLEIKKLKAKLAKSNELLEDEEAALMVKILPSYGQAKSGTIEMDDGTKIVLKVPPCRANASVDEDKVLDQFPDLYRQYCNKFNATLFKKEQLAATAACMKDPQLSSNYTNYEINEVKGK